MKSVTQLCDALLRHHQALGRDLDRLLLPGLAESAVALQASSEPFALPQSAIELFGWRNGTQEGRATFREMAFFPVWYLLCIEESVDVYKRVSVELPDCWGERHFPLFASGAGDYMAITCADHASDDGAIQCYRHASSMEVEFAGLVPMLETGLEAFEKGVYSLDSNGKLAAERKVFAEIARDHNPGVPRWEQPGSR